MARALYKVIVLTKTVKKGQNKTPLHETLFNTEEQSDTVQNRTKQHFLANEASVISRHLDSCSLRVSR